MEKTALVRRMPTELWSKVKAQAALDGIPLRWAVIQALMDWLKKREGETWLRKREGE